MPWPIILQVNPKLTRKGRSQACSAVPIGRARFATYQAACDMAKDENGMAVHRPEWGNVYHCMICKGWHWSG
jgi:hypothetical protein